MTSDAKARLPWVLVSPGFREQAGQDKPNAAVVDHLLARGTPVHLVAHHLAPRFLDREGCTVHRVTRPANSDLFGYFGLRRVGRTVARQVTRQHPGARVLVNGGCCPWPDINWVHFVHAAWRPSRRGMPLRARIKDAVASTIFRRHERESIGRARLVIADSNVTRHDII